MCNFTINVQSLFTSRDLSFSGKFALLIHCHTCKWLFWRIKPKHVEGLESSRRWKLHYPLDWCNTGKLLTLLTYAYTAEDPLNLSKFVGEYYSYSKRKYLKTCGGKEKASNMHADTITIISFPICMCLTLESCAYYSLLICGFGTPIGWCKTAANPWDHCRWTHIDLPLISGTRRSATYSSLADGTSGLINVMHARGPN